MFDRHIKTDSTPDLTFFEANDGEEALKILRTEKIDLIFLDVVMPRMDGFTFLLERQNDENWDEIPVIVITSHRIGESKFQFVSQLNIQKVVYKPLEWQQIKLAYEEIFHKP